MKFYHCPGTRSERVMWMFRELGVEPEIHIVNLFAGEGRKPEFLAINPNGLVPTLVDGDTTLVESAAIVMHLADKFPEKKLAPPIGSRERSVYYQYMVYGPAAIDPAMELVAYHSKILPEARRIPDAVEYGKRRFRHFAKALTTMLGDRRFVLGDAFCAADIIIASGMIWAERYDLLNEHPALHAYTDRCRERPNYPSS